MFEVNPFISCGEHEPVISEVFDKWMLGQGIFDKIMSLAVMPWSDDSNITAEILDIEYFGNRSGSKFCSPLVKYFIDDDGIVPATAREMIAKIIIAKYLKPWQRLWLTNVVAYSPINNYDVTETRNLARSSSEGDVESYSANSSSSSSSSNSREDVTSKETSEEISSGTGETVTHGKTAEHNTSRFGFNTIQDPVPTDRVNSEEGGTTKTDTEVDTTYNITEESSLNSESSGSYSSSASDAGSLSKNKVGAGEEIENLHRVGNIGVTTNQKLISEERNLWIWNYFDDIFKDIDREITLAIFDPCRV